MQHSPVALPGPQRRDSSSTGDREHDAQENTPLLGGMKQQGQQQQGQGSSYLWQQFKPVPPALQQHQQDQVRVLGGGHLISGCATK